MANEYPDLQQFQDPLGAHRCFAPSATTVADQLHVITDPEGRVWMMPGVRHGALYIYGAPPAILVARTVEAGFGVVPEPDWHDVFEVAGYSKRIRDEVKRYLDGHPPISWDLPDPLQELDETTPEG